MLGLRTVRAVCPHDCPDTCGMVVSVDAATGRAVKLVGDPDHPFTQGFLCGKVNRYLERVYHPDRLTTPLKRVGPKGSGAFAPISWDEAVAAIAGRFRHIMRGEYGPEAILPYSYAGTMGQLQYASLDRRFFHLLGASRLDRTICATAGSVGCDITLGTRAVVDPEFVPEARVILNWGSNTSVTNVHLWTRMLEARRRGGTIVTIDPHKSRTAEKSDWWLPIRPGTDGALALAVMHVLWRDGLVDADYLARSSVGVVPLRDRVMADYAPRQVAPITGIAEADIEKLAHLYGTARRELGGPAFIRLNYGLQRHGGGAMAVRTVVCLPALTGDWKHPGGGAMLSTSKLYPFDGAFLTRPDLGPPARTVNMVRLAEALAGELPGPPVKALYVYNANPAAVNPDQGRVLAGLMREDLFTVVHDLFLTDTARYADIVLPATSQLEQFDIHNSYGHLYVQVNPPSILPLGESKPNTEVFRLLAAALELPAEHFALTDRELAARALVPGLVPEGAFAGLSVEALSDGPVRLNVPSPYLPFAGGRFPTESGKCELYSEAERRAGRDPLPHYIPPHEDPLTRPDLAREFPLQLVTPPSPSFLNSTFVNLEHHRKLAGEVVVEMHPRDAESRGLVGGELVRVHNNRGGFRAKLVVGETVHPGVVVSYGIWWNRFTADGVNVNSTTSTAVTDQGGGATFFDNLVQVSAVAAIPECENRANATPPAAPGG